MKRMLIPTSLILFSLACVIHANPIKHILVPKVDHAPKLTGDLSDPVWEKGVAIKLDEAVGKSAGKPLTASTKVKVLRTDDALFFGFDCVHPEAPNLDAKKRERDLAAWSDESVEIFLDRDDFSDYYHLTLNAVGSIYDAHKRDHSWNGAWEGVAKPGDGHWTAEMKVPFAAVGGPPTENSHWLLNVCRNAHLKSENEYSAWAFPGHHRPIGLLCFGPIDPQPLIDSTQAEFLEFGKVEPFLPSEKHEELAALKAAFRELKKDCGGTVEPKRYAEMLVSANDASRRLRPLREIALARLILNEKTDEGKNAADSIAHVTPAGAFVAPTWRIEPNDDDLYSLVCFKNNPKTGRFEEFCDLRFACIEGFSSYRNPSFQRVFRIVDKQNNALYELCHAYTRSQPKKIGRWVARRIKAVGDGVVIDLLNRCGAVTENEFEIPKGPCSMNLSVDTAISKPGDVYLLDDEKHQYPNLPPPSTRERAKHPGSKGARFVSNADPAKAFTLECRCEAISLGVCSRKDSQDHLSVSTGFGVRESIAAYFSPTASTPPPAINMDSNWISTAIERSLATEAGEKVRIWQREIDGLLRLAKESGIPIDTPEINEGRNEFNAAIEQFDEVSRKMEAAAKTATLEDWIRLGTGARRIKASVTRLETSLATIVAANPPPNKKNESRDSR